MAGPGTAVVGASSWDWVVVLKNTSAGASSRGWAVSTTGASSWGGVVGPSTGDSSKGWAVGMADGAPSEGWVEHCFLNVNRGSFRGLGGGTVYVWSFGGRLHGDGGRLQKRQRDVLIIVRGVYNSF